VQDTDHCHGTLIMHTDGTEECVDGRCAGVYADRHHLVVACWTMFSDCDCLE